MSDPTARDEELNLYREAIKRLRHHLFNSIEKYEEIEEILEDLSDRLMVINRRDQDRVKVEMESF